MELDAGDEIQVVNPSGQASNTKDMATILLRAFSSALGLSYEATSRDMSQVNYSSARQNLIEDRESYKEWQHYLTEPPLPPGVSMVDGQLRDGRDPQNTGLFQQPRKIYRM